MPGYVIHLATANEYMRKHPIEIKNKSDFLLGTIKPDFTTKENKGNTHYGYSSSILSLRKYLREKDIDTDYEKGYFLHLVTDYIFYNKLLKTTSKKIYDDYDILNSYLIKKYNVEILDEIKEHVFFKDGDTTILHKELAEKTVDIVSDYDLNEIKNEIMSTDYTEKWDLIRILKRLDK